MSILLADAAIELQDDERITDVPGMCQKAQRQLLFIVYGPLFEPYRAATAHLSALRWQYSPFVVRSSVWGTAGDIFYWFDARNRPHGHTGVRVPTNRLWENSIVHGKGKSGGKGYRKLSQLTPPDLIIRIPTALPVKFRA